MDIELPTDSDNPNFYVKNVSLTRRGITRILKRNGARIIKRPVVLSWFREEVFCEFDINGVVFEIIEPFGDNDEFWIGIKGDKVGYEELQTVINIFRGIKVWQRPMLLVIGLYISSKYLLIGFTIVIILATIWRLIVGSPLSI